MRDPSRYVSSLYPEATALVIALAKERLALTLPWQVSVGGSGAFVSLGPETGLTVMAASDSSLPQGVPNPAPDGSLVVHHITVSPMRGTHWTVHPLGVYALEQGMQEAERLVERGTLLP